MYNYKKSAQLGYADAVAKVKDELKKEGFGVPTEMDVRQTLKTKLNVDFDDYIILDGKTFVRAVLPTVQLGKVGNPKLLPIAEQVENKLKKVVDATTGN